MPRWTAGWAELAAGVERWLLPSECMACGLPTPPDDEQLVCPVCRARWRPISLPICPTCGEHTPLGLACRVCADWPPDFGPVRSAVRLDPPVRLLVHRFKYHGWRRLGESFATRMTGLLAPIGDADLVPVPLARRRRRERGYNQAEELALALGRLADRPVCAGRLRRVRETATQTRLTPDRRRANLAAAFTAAGNRPAVLVDDVFTTGATLVSAATALLDAGAAWVAAVTFARAELPLARSADG